MRVMKKYAAMLIVMIMVFAMATTAFAAGENDGTITIHSATIGETYKIYKIFDATTQNGNTAYTFTKTSAKENLYKALSGEGTPFTLTATADENVFNVTLNEDVNGSEIAVFLKGIEDKMGSSIAFKEADSTTVIFASLSYGYYYVAKAAQSLPGATVGVTSVAPSQTINDKSTKPGPYTPDPDSPDSEDPNNPGGYKVLAGADGKAISDSENTANYGETIYFILQAQATNYDDGKKVVEYTAYDVLGDGFEDFEVTKVTVDKEEITDYSVDLTSSPATITIPWVDAEGDHLYESTSIIKIYCQAVVSEEAVIGTENNNATNTGWFNWEYDIVDENGNPEVGPNNPANPDKETDTVTTKVYAIAIHKTDSQGQTLAGANFEIYNGETKVPVTLATEGDESNVSVYKYDAASTNYTVVSPSSGKIVIQGLAGVSYILKEAAAPAGYNLLTDTITVAAEEFEASTTTMTLYYDENGDITEEETETTEEVSFDVASAAVHVINNAGTELPTTGGIGTKIFYAVGGILMAAAIILIVEKKHMSWKV